MRSFALLPAFALIALTASAFAASNESGVSAAAVVKEMNLARQNPAAYAAYIEEMRENFNGRYFVLPGGQKIVSHEGVAALDEAVRFLKAAQPLQALTLSPGMSRASADHCAEQAGGAIGHGNPASRINRHGKWAACWGENIAYGKTTARDIVLALIVDDGIPGRKHRANIFAGKFNVAGAAYGPHARYGSVCTIDFAGAYFEKTGGLFAKAN